MFILHMLIKTYTINAAFFLLFPLLGSLHVVVAAALSKQFIESDMVSFSELYI